MALKTVKDIGIALILVLILAALPAVLSALGREILLTTILPYIALALFLAGFLWRILLWAKSPVPFRIPATCGQEKSLPWIKTNPVENPAGSMGVILRMFLEIFFFRSLFRNTKMEMNSQRPVYGSTQWLWFFGLLFHWSLLVVILRHLRFFTEPVLQGIEGLAALDGFFALAIPTIYLSDLALIAAVTFLLARRLAVAPLRYICLVQDYFALLLIAAIAGTGLWTRHIQPVDIVAVKAMVMGWLSFSPVAPQGISTVFMIHLFFVFFLLAWFPHSKLMHAPGIFLSPTRNLANNNRMARHINPWDYPVEVHTYAQYEDEFRDKMKAAGLPVEKE